MKRYTREALLRVQQNVSYNQRRKLAVITIDKKIYMFVFSGADEKIHHKVY